MPTRLNQSLADSALLTKSLPLDLLRAFVQNNAADDGLTPQLLRELKVLARTPGLLVACNYGGTLCTAEGISTETLPLASAAIALRALAALPNTHAAVISGRSLRDLAAVSRLPAEVHLVGSHGTEFDMAYAHGLSLATESLLQHAHQALAETIGPYRGITIERKPVAVSVHTRHAAPDIVALATGKASRIAEENGLHFIVDGSVLDLSVVEPAKAGALEHLRSVLGVSAALYAGDASSDELAMATLRGPDMALHVGKDPRGGHRLRDPESFARVLAILFELRRAWLFGEDAVGLERHSMIGNGSSTALITPDAKICWMSHPLPDSGSLFAHLLGGDAAGHFSVEPVKASQVLGQRYVDSTMIVETRWADVTVTDYLEPAPDGITSLVRVLSGTGTARIVFAPRPDYANAPFSMEARGDGAARRGDRGPDHPARTRRRLLHHLGRPPCHRHGRRQPAGRPRGAQPALRRHGTASRGTAGENRAARRRASFPALGAGAAAARRQAVPGPPVRPGAPRPGPRAHRRRAGRPHHVAAGRDRRHPQLGLPVLLAAGRLHDRQRARGPGSTTVPRDLDAQ